MDREGNYREQLAAAVQMLASSAAEQRVYLSKEGFHVDELALDLYDLALVAPDAHDNGWLCEQELAAIQAVDERLDHLSGAENARFWNFEGLLLPEWKEVRMLANKAHRLLVDSR